MTDAVEIWERPEAEEIYMITGWRQWADAGAISSGLPKYLIRQTGARQIGRIRSDGFYFFQFPGTHDLVRPVVRFEEGYPESLKTRRMPSRTRRRASTRSTSIGRVVGTQDGETAIFTNIRLFT